MAGTANEVGVVAELCELLILTLTLFSTKLSSTADIDEVMGGAIEVPAAGDLLSWVENAVGVTLGSMAMDGVIGWFDAALYATFKSPTADGVGTIKVGCDCEFC